MALADLINEDIKTAMREKNEARLRALRAIKAAILLALTDKSGKGLDEAAETQLLGRLLKQRKESMSIYKEPGREDLAQTEQEEIEVIETYMPEQMGEEEVRSALAAIIEQTGASSPQDMGKVMGMAMKQLAGKADGKMISTMVKEMLS